MLTLFIWLHFLGLAALLTLPRLIMHATARRPMINLLAQFWDS